MIEIRHGHSKDHRPDLKQVVLSLVVNGPSAMPLWMEALDGNSSDKTSFPQTMARVEQFQRQLDLETPFKWIADSALYSQDKLLARNDYQWLTRVPETLKAAKTLVQTPDAQIAWVEQPKGYRDRGLSIGLWRRRATLATGVFRAGLPARDKRRWRRSWPQHDEQLGKTLWHLGNQAFGCQADAAKSPASDSARSIRYLSSTVRSNRLRSIPAEVVHRPGLKKRITGYRVVSHYSRDEAGTCAPAQCQGAFHSRHEYSGSTDLSRCGDVSRLQGSTTRRARLSLSQGPVFMVDSMSKK